MYIKINDIDTNYEVSGNGKNVVLLHGWRASLESLTPITRHLEDRFKVYRLDLPGFGKSSIPNNPWNTGDYADFVIEFIKKQEIDNPILIGHSFGGRTLIKLASKNEIKINKMILIDSAGLKPKRKLNYYIKIYIYKILKRITKLKKLSYLREKYIKKHGSEDYRSVSEIMQRVMSITLNEDLKKDMTNIKVPTLLIWGDEDTATPLSDGKTMEKMIKDSGLVVLEGAGHFSFLDKPYQFNAVIDSFLKE